MIETERPTALKAWPDYRAVWRWHFYAGLLCIPCILLIDRIVGTGIAAHEGQLFGWPNQLLGLITAVGLITLCASAVVMWWRRREPGFLGAPVPAASPRFSFGLFLLVVIVGVYLPLFGISLIAVKLLEITVLSRIPRVRDWLGLYVPAKNPVGTANR